MSRQGRKEGVSPAVVACDGSDGGKRGGIVEGCRPRGVEGVGEGRQGPAAFVLIAAAICA